MAVRVQFVPGREPPELLDLAWDAPLATGLRHSDVELARENVAGGLLDLHARRSTRTADRSP